MYSAVNPNCRIIHGASPVTLLKAIRNEQEIAGIHAAMQRDGVALVKFLKWLEEAVPHRQRDRDKCRQKTAQLPRRTGFIQGRKL